MEKIKFKRLTRFPAKNGKYLVTVIHKTEYAGGKTILFEIIDGTHTYLQNRKIIDTNNQFVHIEDFKSMLKSYIRGCPELLYVYYEIVHE